MKIVYLNKNILSLLFVFLYSNANWAQVTLPYLQNFEGSTSEWTLQSSSPNKWVVGTAAKNGGSKGLYISSDNGVSNTYLTSQVTNGSQTYASFQVDLTGISNAELKFDWKSVGFFQPDYGDVWINTGGSDILISYMDPVVNNSQTYGEFTNGSVYANKTISLFPYVGGVVTIKFRWKCGYSILSEFPNPFAIDNVTVTSIAVPAPTINWQSINLTATSATIGFNISSAGSNPITARGVVYGTSPNPTTANSVITSGSGIGVYYANLTGLSIQTHYYFKGYCTTSAGTFYSSQVEFDTNNISAPVTNSASSVGATGFTANWESESLATGYKIDVATSATIFTNYTADSNIVTFDFENGKQTLVNTALSNSNNAGTSIETSNGVYNSANELGNGGEVKKVTGWHNGVGTKYYRVNFNSQAMYNMKLSSKQRSTTNGPKDYKLQYSLGQNGLENWIDISGGAIICADNYTTGVLSDLALPAAMENLAVVSLRWVITSTTAVNGSTLTDAGENNIDDIIIKGSTPQTLVSGYDNLTVSGTSKAVTGLSPLTTYYYRVRSTATGAVSGNSNVVMVTTSYVPCAPTQQPTNLQINGYLNYATGISISFSPVSPAPSGYIVVQYPHGSTPTAPVNETTYSAGNTLGTGKVIYVGTSYNAINITGLTQNTIYDFYVYAYNVTGTCLINYNVTSPLTGSKQTCLTTPSLNAVSSITSSGFTANWSAVSGATSYSISIFSDSNLTQHISGSPFTSNTNLYTATGLTPSATYYFKVKAIGSNSCESNLSDSSSVTLLCVPISQPFTYQFSSSSTFISFAFQPTTIASTGYLTVVYPNGTKATAPTNGTSYNAGDGLGIGTVVYSGTNTSGTATGLSPNTEYDFYTYAYNTSSGCNMIYNTTSPLTGSKQTCVNTPSLNAASSITSSGFTVNWESVSGATSYSISIFSDSNLTQQISGSPFTTNTNSYSATGLTPSATYYFKVKAIVSNSCESNLSDSSSVTLLCVPISQPFAYQFISSSTFISFAFQPTTIASTGYLTVVYPNGTVETAPTNGTSYSAGDILGSGIVGYSGSNNYSFIGNLSSNTVYDFYTYAFNTTQICTKEYNLVSPLFGSFSTCVAVPTSSSATTITNTGFTANWSAVTGATNYTLEVFSNSSLTMYAIYPPFTVTTNSQAVTGLSNTGTYYYRVSANGAASCTSGNSLAQGPISLECNPSTSLAATALSTATSISSISGIFTAALSNAPDGYLVIRTTTNTQPIPVNGTTYTVGSNAIGYIEYVNATAGSWTSTGLTANATYYYWVFSSITTNCFTAPVYSTTTKSFSEKANATATWTGAVNSSWNTGGNWSTGTVPTSNDNIVIDSNTANNTVLDTNYTLAVGQKLTLSGTGTLTIDAISRLTIAGIADFGGKSVTIKSTSLGTGTLGQVTGTLTGATKVTVERYIPAKRAWRAITAPLIGGFNSSVHFNWMNNNQSGVSNATGMLVFGTTTNWGIQMAPNYNLLTYNANDSWSGVSMPIASGTLFSSTINNAFMAFVTGPFGSSNITSGATATTLKANGTLITGSQTYLNLSSNEYKFIGNPYASPISPSAILADNANYSNIWVWDPQLGSYGGYVVYSGSAYSNISGSYTSGQPIQSGQAFFVKPTISSDFVIAESHKSTVVDNGLFDRNATNPELLRVNLSKQIQTQWQPFDAALVLFDSNSSNDVDVQDAAKMFNSTDNITIQNNGIALMADHRVLPTVQDYINLRISETSVGTQYKLSINTEQFANVGLNATLEDFFTNTSLPIVLDGTVIEYQFTTTSDSLSSGNRFRIVFGAVLSNSSSIKSSISVSPNPFTSNNIYINFDSKPEGNYKYSISNVIGQVLENGTINYVRNNVLYPLSIKTAMPDGIYILNITDDRKKEYSVKLIKQ